ncbi:MAG: tyrosine-type recombinase/integrase [Limisphaerales bacterium]
MKTRTSPKAKGAFGVKRGNVTVKIYTGTNRVNDASYPQYTLVYYDGPQRKKRRFSDLQAAKREAELVATRLANGENDVLELTSTDRAVYLQALNELRPFDVPLNVAVIEYANALKHLPAGATLKEAVDFFRRRHPASLEKRTVQQAVDEMLAAKRAANVSPVHLKDLECRLNRFAGSFQTNIGGVSGPLLQAWLDAMDGSGRTKRTYLAMVAALFRFCIKRRYLPKDAIEEVEAVQQAKEDSGEIEILTPGEMREILAAARPEMIAWLAIAGFAGLRSAEIQRLDWSEVNLAERHIEIKASKAKTAARRLAPVTENLALWLAPHVKPAGKVTGFESWWNQIPRVVEAVNAQRKAAAQTAGNDPKSVRKFVWRHNALRHSFCSHRLAVIKNAAQVALEAGNSPQMIFANYRQVVTETEAAKWFSIAPDGECNIIPLQAVGAK